MSSSFSHSVTDASPMVCIGVITSAHGIKGQVNILIFSADPEQFSFTTVYSKDNRSFNLHIQGHKKNTVTASITGITSRNQAESLKGMELYIPRSALPQLEEEEFYYADLQGMQVVAQDNTPLGTVCGLFNFGAGDLLEIAFTDSKTEFFPFTKAVFPIIDAENRRVTFIPPETISERDA